MYAIPVTPFTLDLIAELNLGVRPQMEEKPTYFLTSLSGFRTIIGDEEFKALSHDRKFVTISYLT